MDGWTSLTGSLKFCSSHNDLQDPGTCEASIPLCNDTNQHNLRFQSNRHIPIQQGHLPDEDSASSAVTDRANPEEGSGAAVPDLPGEEPSTSAAADLPGPSYQPARATANQTNQTQKEGGGLQ